jgi:anti-anti-sigma factor
MGEHLDIKAALQQMHVVFSNTALQCADAFFSLPCAVYEPFKVVETLNPRFDFLLSIAGSSRQYRAISFAGAHKNLLSTLLKKGDISAEEARDILGMYSSAFWGMLQNNRDFAGRFGVIEHGTPSLYSGGNVFLPFIWGIEGSITIQNNTILYVAFSIREIEPVLKWEGFYPLKVETRQDIIWIKFPGSLNLRYFSEIKNEKIMDLLANPRGIVLDLTKVADMLSAYVGLIAHLGKVSMKKNIPINIIVSSPNCRKVIESTNISKIAMIYDSEKELLDALQ